MSHRVSAIFQGFTSAKCPRTKDFSKYVKNPKLLTSRKVMNTTEFRDEIYSISNRDSIRNENS